MPPEQPQGNSLPFFPDGVAAGFPAPSSDDSNEVLDLNSLCVRHPAATYYIRARGESMIGAGINDGDVLVVDRSVRVRNGDIIIASVAGEFTVKRLEQTAGRVRLLPANPAFPPIEITPELGAEFFGVVTWIVKRARNT